MLLSMTGFGNARRQDARLDVAVEIRTVNNRYLKVNTKCSDAFAPLESRIEKAVRQRISRGTVSVVVKVVRLEGEQQYALNFDAIETYWRQLRDVSSRLDAALPSDLSCLLALPGTVAEPVVDSSESESCWPFLHEVLHEALSRLHEFRAQEGRSMQEELRINCGLIAEELDRVETLAPQVVRDYRDRLHERVRELLDETDTAVDSSNLIREVSIFAERCDINEEVTRLRCHLDQFGSFLKQDGSFGRKLEFLSQEMFREVNTIGSKANNVSIAHSVVEMKGAVEKIREILQNVE